MGLFDKMLKEEESLFLDTIALDVDFVPGIVKYRENEQQYVAQCIKPLLQKRSGKNLLITGSPGIGKTVAVKHLLRELGNEYQEIITLYINCWKKETPHKIALELCDQLDFKFTHNKDTTDLFRDIAKILNKKAVVIVLDEADKILGDELFYSLSEDIYKKTLVFITNEKTWLATLDARVRSRLMTDTLEFKPYTYDETFNILKERIDYAFVKGVFHEEALAKIAEKTFDAGDLRVGLFLLKEAGEIAESKASRSVTPDHAAESLKKLEAFSIKSATTLDEEEQRVLDVIKTHFGKTAKQIFELYTKQHPISYSSFQRRIKNLEKGRFIALKKINEGHFGNTTLILEPNHKLSDF